MNDSFARPRPIPARRAVWKDVSRLGVTALALGVLFCTPVLSFAAAKMAQRIEIVREVSSGNDTTIAIAFDYDRGTAWRIVRDVRTGRVLSKRRIRGRPQSSRHEFQRAVSIISRTATLAGLMDQGAVAEGGFIVDGPADHPAGHRYIQVRLLSADRRSLLRVVLVDLSAGVVASARDWFE